MEASDNKGSDKDKEAKEEEVQPSPGCSYNSNHDEEAMKKSENNTIATDSKPPSLTDSDNDDDTEVLRNLLVNFMKAEHPYQAIDDMAVRNPKCNKK